MPVSASPKIRRLALEAGLIAASWLLFGLAGSATAAYAPSVPDQVLAWDPAAREFVVRQAVSPDPAVLRGQGLAAAVHAPAPPEQVRPGRVRVVSQGAVESSAYHPGLRVGRGRNLQTGQRLYVEYTYPNLAAARGALRPAAGLERASLRQENRLKTNRIELTLSDKLERSDGVIRPPDTGAGRTITPPDTGTTPVLPPAGSPGSRAPNADPR